MADKARTDTKPVFIKSKKLYVLLSLLYAYFALSEIRHLPAITDTTSHHIYPISHWLIWIQIAATIVCIFTAFEVFRSVKNGIEKAIAIITMIYFVLALSPLFHALGYRWLSLPQSRWEFAGLMLIAAILMFVRTFQVFRGARID